MPPPNPRGLARPWVIVAAVASAFLASTAPPASAVDANMRDVGVEAGLDDEAFSFDVHAHDFDDDGWTDLLLVHHGGATQVMRNTGDGFVEFARLVDTLHDRADRHGCAWGDVNLDGNDDIYCTKGAHRGTSDKWNELWIQDPPGTFTDRAAAYDVEDNWGRGRLAVFMDLNHDEYPDLFVGNEYPRQDGRRSPNRTFLNVDGTHFEEVRIGLTREAGAECVQAVDVDGDGWEDVLLCGKEAFGIFLRRENGFVERTEDLGVSTKVVKDAYLATIDEDGVADLIWIRRGIVQIQRGRGDGTFEAPVEHWRLRAGSTVAVGDIDGVDGPDIFVVQGCTEDGVNLSDVALMNRGGGDGWDRERVLLGAVAGCGDIAATLDFDHDGMDDVVVMNGRPLTGGKGPDQLLTGGDWTAQPGS